MKKITIRALTKDDLNAVVAIDTAIEDHSRRDYIERRLAAALREPALHLQLAATDGGTLLGYVLGRILIGEFGHPQAGLRLEIVGVRSDARQRRGRANVASAHGPGPQTRTVRSSYRCRLA